MAQLVPVRLKPGINRELTRFAGEGGWYDCDKVRFRQGFPQSIGGWSRLSEETFLGTCRSIYTWTVLDGDVYMGLGTTWKFYILASSALYDITPIRVTTSAGDVTFAATNGSATITVTDTNHGAFQNDFVTFSGAASLGGNVTAAVLNAEHQIATIVDANTYTIELGVTANASDSGNGGASVVGEYQINVGLDTGLTGTGWGADAWGDGGWGEAGAATAGAAILRTWSQDNFGEDLIINPVDGGVYYWDASVGTGTRAVEIGTLAGASNTPTISHQTMVSDQDRHVICFGCDAEDNPGIKDPLLIRWSDQESVTDWTTRTTNTAGSIRLSRGAEIIRAIQTKREIVIFTDQSMHSMQFIGPPYTFGIQEISSTSGLVSALAVATVDDRVFWMSNGGFMTYDGTVRELDCSVRSYVFDDFNKEQRQKVAAGHNIDFSEVWWFYPSAGSEENDRYVIYNYSENLWYFGNLVRTAWHPTGISGYPVAAGTDGRLYEHENGMNDGSQNPPASINSYIESATFDIAEGRQFFFANRVIPDVTFVNSTGTPQVTMTLKARRFPGSSFASTEAMTTSQTATVPIEQFTEQHHIRLRGRSMAMRLEANDLNLHWRLGVPRIDIRTDGRR